jgi:hypothetical protein
MWRASARMIWISGALNMLRLKRKLVFWTSALELVVNRYGW